MDISQEKSVVRNLTSEGLDVYLLDWGYPSWEDSSLSLSLDDYVNYVQDAVQSLKNMACVDKISILGYCWGGIIALIMQQETMKTLEA
jgi:polyhydroxyalkanoate synthase